MSHAICVFDAYLTAPDELVEVTGPAGTDLAGWSIPLYNGNGGENCELKLPLVIIASYTRTLLVGEYLFIDSGVRRDE